MKSFFFSEKLSIGLLVVTLFFVLVSLILNIVIVINQSSVTGNLSNAFTCNPTEKFQVNNSQGFKEAAKFLLQGIDINVDPCQDFYAFTCNKYLKSNPVPRGGRRVGTYDLTQKTVYDLVKKGIEPILDEKSTVPWSKTEKIVAKAYNLCYKSVEQGLPDKSLLIQEKIVKDFNGFPALDSDWLPLSNWTKFWETVGNWESRYGVASLLSSYVTVDSANTSRNALYINQAGLMQPRDFYVKPQFLKQMEQYLAGVIKYVNLYNNLTGSVAGEEVIVEACTQAVQFEIQLALAVVPNDLLRNYRQQYNSYSIAALQQAYPSIQWSAYLKGLGLNDQDIQQDNFIGQQWPQSTLVNFIVIRMLMNYSSYLGGRFGELKEELKGMMPSKDYHREATSDDISQTCISMLTDNIPYGIGYIYVKNIAERDQVKEDVKIQTELVISSFLEMVDTLDWITEDAKNAAKAKSAGLVKNVGWPAWFDFTNTTTLDAYHTNYYSIEDIDNFFDAILAMQWAVQLTENLGLLKQKPDRTFFSASPAVVNAWYQPERNSITFPYAAFNPPYYQ